MQTRVAWPPFTRNIKITLAGLAILWLVAFEATAFVRNYMVVSVDAIARGQIWTLFTHALWHMDFFHLLFNGFALWMFGGEVDRRWDDAWFWGFCAICAVGGGIAVVLSQAIFGGSASTLGYSGAVMGLVAAYCWHNWDRPLYFFFLRLRGKWLLPFFVLVDLFMIFGVQEPISMSGHLGGMATGLLLVSGYWRPRRLKLAIKRWKAGRSSGGSSRSPDRKTNDGRWLN